MRSMLALATALATPVAMVAASSKAFTPEDMLSAPRPQPPIANYNGTHAISVVDNWEPKTDK
jgi:hypothetical protein